MLVKFVEVTKNLNENDSSSIMHDKDPSAEKLIKIDWDTAEKVINRKIPSVMRTNFMNEIGNRSTLSFDDMIDFISKWLKKGSTGFLNLLFNLKIAIIGLAIVLARQIGGFSSSTFYALVIGLCGGITCLCLYRKLKRQDQIAESVMLSEISVQNYFRILRTDGISFLTHLWDWFFGSELESPGDIYLKRRRQALLFVIIISTFGIISMRKNGITLF